MDFIIEPEKKIPVKDTCDLCIVGGSCTGVFAEKGSNDKIGFLPIWNRG